MARAVILWNEHPTEVVAGFHARQVARILKEKYGHDIGVVKIPTDMTSFGILRNEKKPMRDRLLELAKDHFTSDALTQIVASKWRMPVFNFHSSSATDMAQATRRKPHEFRVSRRHSLKRFLGEIEVAPTGKNAFCIETPAHYRKLPPQRAVKEALREVPKMFWGLTKPQRRALTVKLITYQDTATPLLSPRQKKYLHPAISEKIAAEIHARLTEGKK